MSLSEIINRKFRKNLTQDLIDKKFTDVELVLIDHLEKITLHLHKSVLIFTFDYFYKMFSFNNRNRIEMIVPNAKIMEYIIMLYGYDRTIDTDFPYWKQVILEIKCRDYLQLEYDASLLHNLIVPAEGFDLLIDLLNFVDIMENRRLIRTIRRNMPENYDINKLSPELYQLIEENKKIIVQYQHSVDIYDLFSGDIAQTLDVSSNKISISPNGKYLAIITNSGHIGIWDIYKYYHLVYNKKDFIKSAHYSCLDFSSDSTKIIVSTRNKNNILFTEIDFINQIKTIVYEYIFCEINYEYNDKFAEIIKQSVPIIMKINLEYIVFSSKSGAIKIINMVDKTIIELEHCTTPPIINFIFSPDNEFMVSYSAIGYSVWCTNTWEKISTTKIDNLNQIAFDAGYLIITTNQNVLRVDYKNGTSENIYTLPYAVPVPTYTDGEKVVSFNTTYWDIIDLKNELRNDRIKRDHLRKFDIKNCIITK